MSDRLTNIRLDRGPRLIDSIQVRLMPPTAKTRRLELLSDAEVDALLAEPDAERGGNEPEIPESWRELVRAGAMLPGFGAEECEGVCFV